MILFLGDRSISAARMAEEFRRRGYAGDVLTHEWNLASDAEMARANRDHERHGVTGLPDAAALVPLVAGHRDQITGIVTHFFPVTAALLDELPSLRFVGTVRSGTQNIDEAAATARGVEICRNPGRNAAVVADFAVGLMHAVGRGIAHAHHQLLGGEWLARQEARSFRTLGSERIGLVGFGQIGHRVARLLSGFECPVSVYDPYADRRLLDESGVHPAGSLRELLEGSSLVSLHAAVTAETRLMIGAQQLEWLGRDGILINTARAELADEEALLAALEQHTIWGVGLDVFGQEPLPAGHPLFGFANVTLTPHLAGLSRDAVPLAIDLLVGRLGERLSSTDADGRAATALAQGAVDP